MELLFVGRFDWERWIRRLILPQKEKYHALMLATYADPDGSRVRPGTVVMAAVTNTSEATVKRHMDVLRERGLIKKVKQGNRHARRADEYQLTIPANILELPMLDPDEQPQSGAHQ